MKDRISIKLPLSLVNFYLINLTKTSNHIPKLYEEFFNRAPLKSKFCGPKDLQQGIHCLNNSINALKVVNPHLRSIILLLPRLKIAKLYHFFFVLSFIIAIRFVNRWTRSPQCPYPLVSSHTYFMTDSLSPLGVRIILPVKLTKETRFLKIRDICRFLPQRKSGKNPECFPFMARNERD